MHAYRNLVARGVSSAPVPPEHCLDRDYNRLNQGYQWLHWLCHFILSNSGPSQHAGASATRPFVVDLPVLFERFVYQWLRLHTPPGLVIDAQQRLPLHASIEFIPDLVVRDASGAAWCVLDTKYKIGNSLVQSDVAQVVAYATALGCTEAVLVYPSDAQPQVAARIGGVRLRTLSFCLQDDLDRAGYRLLEQLIDVGVGSMSRSGALSVV